MGRRQAVRHWILIPAFAGSIPAAPAIYYTPISRWDRSEVNADLMSEERTGSPRQ